jgi:hypothetical protein
VPQTLQNVRTTPAEDWKREGVPAVSTKSLA